MPKRTKADLSKYTRAELEDIIAGLVFQTDPFGRLDHLGYVLSDIDHKRALRKIDTAHAHGEKADAARARYIELLKKAKEDGVWSSERLAEMKECLVTAEKEEKLFLKLSKEVDDEYERSKSRT